MTDSRERATGPNGVGRSGRGGKVNDLSAAMKGGGGGSTTAVEVAEVIVTPETTTMVVGDTRRFTAQARDPLGRLIGASRAPTAWGVSNPTFCSLPVRIGTATVEVTALAAGTVALDATANGVTGSATILVQSAPSDPDPAPASALSVSHATRAFVATEGGASPAPQTVTWINPAGLTGLVVAATTAAPWLALDTVAGVTTFTVTTPATTAGSPLTATVRGTQAGASGSPVSVTVTFTVNDAPSEPPGDTPADVVLYGAPIQLATDTAALGGAFVTYDTNFPIGADHHWTAEGPRWEGFYYDRGLAYYGMWARTGNATWRERADAQVDAYLRNYVEPNNYLASAHWTFVEGASIHYRLTGDERSRTAVVRMAEVLCGYLPEYMTPGGGDLRILSRMLTSAVYAWELTANGTDLPPATWTRDWAARLDLLLATALAWEEDGSDPTRGIYPVAVTCWTTMNYQVALLLHALIAVHDRYSASPAIVAQVQRAADWLWATQWQSTGFQYLSGSCASVGGTEIAGDLTGLFVGVWGWLADRTGDATYRTQGDAMFAAMVAGGYLYGSKQFNQLYATSWRYLGWRAASL